MGRVDNITFRKCPNGGNAFFLPYWPGAGETLTRRKHVFRAGTAAVPVCVCMKNLGQRFQTVSKVLGLLA